MKKFIKTGRLLYGIGLIALGVHQLIIKDFRQEILPPFPAWAHKYSVFPMLAGIALIFAGAIISGLVTIKTVNTKNICLYLGFCFLILIITCHLPYILIFSPDKASRLDVWFGAGEELERDIVPSMIRTRVARALRVSGPTIPSTAFSWKSF